MDIDKVSSMIDELFEPMLNYKRQVVKVKKTEYQIRENRNLGNNESLQSLLDLELKINEDSKSILAKILEQKALEFAAKIREMEGSK